MLNRTRTTRRGLLALLLVMTAAAAGPSPIEARTLSFGVVPQQSASKLLASWGPVLDFLERRTGHSFEFRTAPDIPTFEQRLADGDYDFAYMNPYHFTVFNAGDDGYQAVARARNKRIRGILVVRNDSAIRELADLAGQQLAFPAPAAFAASVLPRAHLAALGIAFTPRYVSSHDSVYKSVAREFFIAGGGVVRTFNATDPKVRAQLRVLWSTPGYTPHAIAAHARIEAASVDAVRTALVSMDADAAAQTTLERLNIEGFQSAANADWDDVRALEIDTRLGGRPQAQ